MSGPAGPESAVAPEARFRRIVEEGLCLGCGLCQALAGRARIAVGPAANGEMRPRVIGPLDDATVDRIYATCPGTRVGGLPEAEAEAAPHRDLVWGPYHRLVHGWAADPAVRHEGSTGGALTALGQYLLRSGRVEGVLHVRAAADPANFGEATLSATEAEVLAAAGSRYRPTAALLDLDAALARGAPLALVAKPCDLAAVRNLARLDPRVDAVVRYWLTPVCGGFMPTASLHRFLIAQGIAPDQVTRLRYRGRGCPGPTRVETRDGARRDFDYLDVWGEDESAWSLPFRCKICPDGIGEGADIAAADSWPGGSPDRATAPDDPGSNALILRTARGVELLEAAVRDGALELGAELDTAALSDMQPHQVKKKLATRARLDALRAAGRLAPETPGLRTEALAAANGAEANAREAAGTARRAAAGDGLETAE